MDALIVEYMDDTGLYIVRISEKKYYYGNGKDTNGIGIAPNQFLRFNPSMDYVSGKNIPVPQIIKDWISSNGK